MKRLNNNNQFKKIILITKLLLKMSQIKTLTKKPKAILLPNFYKTIIFKIIKYNKIFYFNFNNIYDFKFIYTFI